MNDLEIKLQGLCDYHRMGQIKLQAREKLSTAEKALMAKYSSLNPDTQRKVVNFAFAKQGYTQAELDRLIDLCRDHEFTLSFSHIERLLSIPKEDRWAAQKKIVEGKWSRRDLDWWIKGQYGSRTKAGRHPKGFSTPEALEGGIASACLSWLRQEENIERTNAEAFNRLPPRIVRLYKQASQAISVLHDELQNGKK